METTSVSDLVERLGREGEDSTRKMAAFRLQSAVGDPSFAEVFVAEGGLPKLQYLCLHATGNTLAYSLTSLSKLLELDRGWERVDARLVERVVQLVVNQPLVNILRGAMSILVSVVSYPHSHPTTESDSFGFKALKPSIAVYPQFLGMLVSRLSSGDHILSANALQLVNALMRDALINDTDAEWSRFIKKLQDLGVIKAVYLLMQSTALTDLAPPLLEFQQLTKMMLKKWRDVAIDMDKPEHRRALRALDTASYPSKPPGTVGTVAQQQQQQQSERGSRKHQPDRWRRLGFETESPAWEFEHVGFLGMMDVTDFVRKDQDQYQKLLLEQSGQPPQLRCPLARASLSVTAVLYEHFEVDKAADEDAGRHHDAAAAAALDARPGGFDRAFRPLLLHWSRLHTAGLGAFLRLWRTTGAEADDFDKVEDLVRILVEQVVGQAPRIKEMQEVEDELTDFDYHKLRELQMELLELTFEDAWGHHLRQVRDELHHEALQFVKEQRIRCLLEGDWFPHLLGYEPHLGPVTKQSLARNVPSGWRYVRLSHNRRYLHYADFDARVADPPPLDELHAKVDLSIVSSVDSKVSTSRPSSAESGATITDGGGGATGVPSRNGAAAPTPNGGTTPSTNGAAAAAVKPASMSTTLTIRGYLPPATTTLPTPPRSRAGHVHGHGKSSSTAQATTTTTTTTKSTTSSSAAGGGGGGQAQGETVLLTLHPQTHTLASEWLDGLLMLLDQQPITADTNKLVRLVGGYGLRIRLLNVRFEDVGLRGPGNGDGSASSPAGGEDEPPPPLPGQQLNGVGRHRDGGGAGEVKMPSREGLDEDYYYDIAGM